MIKLQKSLRVLKRRPTKKSAALKIDKTKPSRTRNLKVWLTHRRLLIIKTKRLKTSKELSFIYQRRSKKPMTAQRKQRWQAALAVMLVLYGIVGAIYFNNQAHKPTSTEQVNQFSVQEQAPELSEIVKGLPASKPVSIDIPVVGIEAPVGLVGQDKNGAIDVPGSPTDTAWYKFSPTPGERGPAIIVGHVDYHNYGPAIFWNLYKLKAGDKIKIKRADGKTVTFEVTSLKSFEQDKFPADKVYGNIKYPGLRLITCGGTFNYTTGHYDHNTVVFAKLDKIEPKT